MSGAKIHPLDLKFGAIVGKLNLKNAWEGKKELDSVFYEATKPVIMLLRLSGRFPYQRKDGKMILKMLSPLTFASIAIYFLQWYFMRAELMKMNDNIDLESNLLSKIILVFVLFDSLLPFTAWIEWPLIRTYYNLWTDFEYELWIKTKIQLKKPLIRIIVIPVVEIPSMVLVGLIEYDMLSSYSWAFMSFVFGTMYIVIHMYMYFWIFGCLMISQASETLLKYTLLVAKKGTASELYSCRVLWMRIARLATDLGDSVAPTIIATFLMTGVIFVTSSFALISNIKIGRFSTHTIPFLTLLLTAVIAIFLICDSAHRTTYNIGTKFSSELLKINSSILSDKVHKEMKTLIHLSGTEAPSIKLAGFFITNRNLFVSFLSTTVTYLIVMMQFATSDSDLVPANNTEV